MTKSLSPFILAASKRAKSMLGTIVTNSSFVPRSEFEQVFGNNEVLSAIIVAINVQDSIAKKVPQMKGQ